MTSRPLPPCPASPNCVSTQAAGRHAIEPMRYSSTSDAAVARLLAVVRAMPRTRFVSSYSHSIRSEFRTRLFRFVDDVQFELDEETKTIHFRSASRVGHSDLGVNRARMEAIRKAFESD